jgi:cytochrome P450
MERDSVDYFRKRARDECEAALNAACEEARRAHTQMASAYARLVQLHELRQIGALPTGKVTSMADALHNREQTVYGASHAPARQPALTLTEAG